MFNQLPTETKDLIRLTWADLEPYYRDLQARPFDAATVQAWLADWSTLYATVEELFNRLQVGTTVNTIDKETEQRYNTFLEAVYPHVMQAEQGLKTRLIESGVEPEGFAVPLRNMRAESDLYTEANLPLLAEEQKLATEYDRIIGAQTVQWEGREVPLPQLEPALMDTDRARRERAWRTASERQLADRQIINHLWQKFLALRQNLAANAGRADYRAYRWQQLLRFDYTPEDARRFHQAIEEAVVPAAKRIYERRRQRLGVDMLRPWDLEVDPQNLPPLTPFKTVDEQIQKTSQVFHQVDPQLGGYFDTMAEHGLLDLDNRKNKAPGGYCTSFSRVRLPFIFMNSVGTHDNVQTLLHEGGHAFHLFESRGLPYIQQLSVPMEFAEVASMSMEFLASPYLAGNFYTEAEAARARIQHIEGSILFWPYMAVVDAFQHWVYENPQAAADPANCDAAWTEQWQRFMPGVDWSGLADELATGWHRKLHIHTVPFYYVEYGLAQLGAVQIWRNALADQAASLRSYRSALALGGTRTLPELFRAAGARLAFDAGILREAVDLMESTITRLETA